MTKHPKPANDSTAQPTPQPVPPATPVAVPHMTFTTPATAPQTAPPPPSQSIAPLLERVEEILHVIQRHERRERLKMAGSFIRHTGFFAIMIASTWYFYVYGEALLMRVSENTAAAAAKFAEQQSDDLLDRLNIDLQSLPIR